MPALSCGVTEPTAAAASASASPAASPAEGVLADARPGHSWVSRHALVAGTAGVALGAASLVVVRAFGRPELGSTPSHELAACGYGALCWLALGLVLGTFTLPLVHTDRGRRCSVALGVAVYSALALTQAADVALRILSGSFLSRDLLAFAYNARQHLAHAATGGYLLWALALLATLLAFGAVFARALAKTERVVAVRPAPPLVMALALSAVVTFVFARRDESRFARHMFASGPLLGLASSMVGGHEEPEPLGASAYLQASVPEGPPRSAETAVLARAREPAQTKRPNVLLVMLESIAVSHLGFSGYARPTTPNLDRLAREGLLMRRAWTTATHSNYAQMAVLSALVPRRGTGLDLYTRLDYPRFLFHDLFATLGYATATITSQDEEWQGMRRFQATNTPTDFWHSRDFTGTHLDSGVERTVPDEHTASEAIGWLNRHADRNFALYVNLQSTHFPYTLAPGAERPFLPDEPSPSTFTYFRYPESEVGVVQNRYDNALAHVDRQVGRLVRALEMAGVLDDTLIVVTADHGEQFFERGLVTHGQTLHEIEARVPLLLRWPRGIRPEARTEPVSHVDVLPTIAEVVGAPMHPSWQGKSFLAPRPAGSPPRAIFLDIQGLRLADAIVCWPYKLIFDRTTGLRHLYDLERDPNERDDRAEAEPLVAQGLGRTLAAQIEAQLDYHAYENTAARAERFQPRLAACPSVR